MFMNRNQKNKLKVLVECAGKESGRVFSSYKGAHGLKKVLLSLR